jgi:hypothetical protein
VSYEVDVWGAWGVTLSPGQADVSRSIEIRTLGPDNGSAQPFILIAGASPVQWRRS